MHQITLSKSNTQVNSGVFSSDVYLDIDYKPGVASAISELGVASAVSELIFEVNRSSWYF